MTDLAALAELPDDELGVALRALAGELSIPERSDAEPDVAARVRARVAALPRGRGADAAVAPRLRLLPARRPVRRGLVLAAAAALIVAAIAGAVGLGLPGLRFVTAPPTPASSALPASPASAMPSASSSSAGSSAPSQAASPSPSASSGPAGSGLGLGDQLTLADARRLAPFAIVLPVDPRFGPPDTVWLDDVGRVSLVWGSRPGVPDTVVPGVAMIVSEFAGRVDAGYFEKILAQGTTVEPVRVGGTTGYWISGAPHDFVYVDPSGQPTFDDRRKAGDTLAWSTGRVTNRIETGLGRDATVAIAEAMR